MSENQKQPFQGVPYNKAYTLNDFLQQDSAYFSEINKSLPIELITDLCQFLLQQREQSKINGNKIEEKINDLQVSLQNQRVHFHQLKQYVRVLEQQCENLKNMITFKQQESQRRIKQLNQSSVSMIQQMVSELKVERQTNLELKNVLKEIKQKDNQIRKLTISISKLTQQNQSLKQLKNWNKLLSQQFVQSEQKLAVYKVQQKQLRDENEILRSKIEELEERIEEFQYISCNQMTKVKQLLSQNLGSCQPRQRNVQNDTNQKENAVLLKQVQENFQSRFFQEKDIIRQSSQRMTKTQQGKNMKIYDFESSLDQISENFDKISLKEIEASSKGNVFTEEIFNSHNPHEIEVRGFQSTKNKQKQAPKNKDQKIKQFIEQPQQKFAQIPLSLQNKKHTSQIGQSIPKKKINLNIKIPSKLIQQTPNSSRSEVVNIKNIPFISSETPKVQPSRIRSRSKTNTQFQQNLLQSNPWFKNKEREAQRLQKRLKQEQKTVLQQSNVIGQLQKRMQQQINAFKQQTFFQIETIQRLTAEIKEQKLKNIQDLRKKDQVIQEMQKICEKQEQKINKQNVKVQKEKKMKQELLSRLMEVQQQKWKYNQYKIQNAPTIDKQVQWSGKPKHMSKHQILSFHFCQLKKLVDKEISTESIELRQTQTQTQRIVKKSVSVNTQKQQNRKILFEKNTNTQISYFKIDVKVTQVSAKDLIQCIDRYVGSDKQNQFSSQLNSAALVVKKLNFQKLFQIVLKGQSKQCEQVGTQAFQNNLQQLKIKNQILSDKQKQKNKKKKHKQKQKEKQFQEWPIKQFKPTSLLQQMIENNEPQAQVVPTTDKTMYYSFSQQPQIQQIPIPSSRYPQLKTQFIMKKQGKKEQEVLADLDVADFSEGADMLKINSILQRQLLNKSFACLFKLPVNIQKQKFISLNAKGLKIAQIIEKLKKPNNRSFFIFMSLLKNSQGKVIPDKVLLWKQGLISLHFQSGLIMSEIKKYVSDPLNLILGNSQIILDKGQQTIRVKRNRTKNYFTGNIEDCSWKIISVQYQGEY